MSINVLVIPEDPTHDGYILKPIVQAIFVDIGKPNANVRICRDPNLGGIGEAMKWTRLREIVSRYGMVDIFLLCVDRDAEMGREEALTVLENRAAEVLMTPRSFLSCAAWQELEAWILAGLDLPGSWIWENVRQERDCKEGYFAVLAKERGVASGPGGGRKALALEVRGRLPRIMARSPEIAMLRNRIADCLG